MNEYTLYGHIVLEMCEMSLQSYLEQCDGEELTTYYRSRIYDFARQIASGIQAMHARGIIHNDIKTENVLLKSNGGDNFVCKLTDFDKSVILSDLDATKDNKAARRAVTQLRVFECRYEGGTFGYKSPESVQHTMNCGGKKFFGASTDISGGKPIDIFFGIPTDIYSYGVLMWSMWSRIMPGNTVDMLVPGPAGIRTNACMSAGSTPTWTFPTVKFSTDQSGQTVVVNLPRNYKADVAESMYNFSAYKALAMECYSHNPSDRPTIDNVLAYIESIPLERHHARSSSRNNGHLQRH